MESSMNDTNNDEMSGVRPVKAPGFANEGVGSGDTSGGVTQVDGGNDVDFQDKPKKSHGMLYGMILLAILAAGGIGFGVWAMLDGNSQVAKKNEQISDLRSQLVEKNEVVDDTTVVDVESDNESGVHNNPVITSTNSSKEFQLHFDSSVLAGKGDDGANIIGIDVKNGKVEKCELGRRTYGVGTPGYSTLPVASCDIVGLEGDVYKVIEFGAGQVSGLNRIGFIMIDGSVKYTLPIDEASSNNDLSIKGSLSINGKVNDAVNVNVTDIERGYGGYGATVFVLSDGSYVEYSDSMTQ